MHCQQEELEATLLKPQKHTNHLGHWKLQLKSDIPKHYGQSSAILHIHRPLIRECTDIGLTTKNSTQAVIGLNHYTKCYGNRNMIEYAISKSQELQF